MNKIKTFLRRVKNMSFDRMWMHVKEISKKSGKSKILIFCDMLWCAFRYGIGYLDYNVFGFAYVKGKKARSTYMTMNHNLQLVRGVNDKAYDCKFTDKIQFNEAFDGFIGRKWIDLRKCGEDGLRDFIKGKENVFVKVTDDCGGNGVEKINLSENEDAAALYSRLMEKKQYLVEESLVQHEKMNLLNPSSINTLRVTSVLSKGVPHIMYCLVRMGDGTKNVDNISSGGMYCPVNEDGVIYAPAFCDKTGMCYDKHPMTGTEFEGFEIPYYHEAIELVKKAALVVPQIRYVGWDVAICEDGPVLIEGNTIPGYDMCQNHNHIKNNGGILPKFQAVFGENLSDLS